MALFHKQPASMIYAFDRGWRIEKYVTIHLFQQMHQFARTWFRLAMKAQLWSRRLTASSTMNRWFGYALTYGVLVYIAGIYVAGGVQYLSAMIMTALFLTLQSIFLSLWVVLSFILIGLLASYTFVYARYYRIFQRCPGCHEPMDIPIFTCPDCQQDHDRLWPSIYGVFSHRCKGPDGKSCGRLLPSVRLRFFALSIGRAQDDISRHCPHCTYVFGSEIGQAINVHLPIVGGPSAGKSSYILTATNAFKNLYQNRYGYTVQFADDQGTREYTQKLEGLLQTGFVEGTRATAHVTRAYTMKIQAPRAALSSLAYFYDAPGEAYMTIHNAREQKYFHYAHGILFVVDPFFIPEYRMQHEAEFGRYEAQGMRFALGLDPQTVYERMFSLFEEKVGLSKGKAFSHPLAVVVSKADAFSLEEEIGSSAAQKLMSRDAKITHEEDALHKLVQDFLIRYGMGPLVQNITMQFKQVRYFSCSALGRMPSGNDRSPYTSRRVEAPLIWLLTRAHAIEPPIKLEKPIVISRR
jgi:hypothetical protein